MSQEVVWLAVAGFAAWVVPTIGAILLVWAKIAVMETTVKGIESWLRSVAEGRTPGIAALTERLGRAEDDIVENGKKIERLERVQSRMSGLHEKHHGEVVE